MRKNSFWYINTSRRDAVKLVRDGQIKIDIFTLGNTPNRLHRRLKRFLTNKSELNGKKYV